MLENEIVEALRPSQNEDENFVESSHTKYLNNKLADDQDDPAYMVMRNNLLENQTSMKVLYDECPTEFQFGMK